MTASGRPASYQLLDLASALVVTADASMVDLVQVCWVTDDAFWSWFLVHLCLPHPPAQMSENWMCWSLEWHTSLGDVIEATDLDDWVFSVHLTDGSQEVANEDSS